MIYWGATRLINSLMHQAVLIAGFTLTGLIIPGCYFCGLLSYSLLSH